MAQNYYDSFIKKLQEIFMMDHAELDFGIYRIMNQKRQDIEHFLTKELLPQVKQVLESNGNGDADKAKKRMAEIVANVGGNIEVLPKGTPMRDEYDKLQAQVAQTIDTESMQAQVFSHLVTFFSRYYEGGDFISKRRYKDNTYAIPYNGEEVKLHWANADQYYIKTSEYFRNYTFILPTSRKKVHFVLKDASTEQNNNKSANNMERRFALFQPENAEDPVIEETADGDLNIYFTYELMPKNTKQKDLCTAALNEIAILTPTGFAELLDVKAPTKDNPNRTLLEKHLTDYTAKNSFDYFIHKDLGGFLNRELDFFIKNEVLHIDDLDPQHINNQLTIVRAIKQVGEKIIRMLAQLENFQRRLWLKKKFVVQSDYCITLDRVPEKLYPEIIANDAQRKEWVRLFAIDEIKGDMMTEAYSEPLTIEFLKQNPFLVLDTAFFDEKFKHIILASMDNVDEQTNGLLANSDNINFIRLIQNKYLNCILCIHIDPPYNTDTSGFLYKNNFRHSSWMSMMDERIEQSLPLLKIDASFICHIDENEYENLFKLFKQHNLNNLGTVVWDKRNPMTGGHGIALQHEYMTWFSPSSVTISTNTESARIILEKVKELISRYKCINDVLRSEYRSWLNSNEESEGGEKSYNNIDDKGRVYQSVSLRAPEPRTDPKFHQPLVHPITHKPCPVPPNGFSRTPETMAAMIERGDIIFGIDERVQPRYKMYLTYDTKKQMTSVIANAIKGKAELVKMGFDFPYCHSTTFYNTIISSCAVSKSIILDYFAGSGTTGHTVIEINRNNNNSIDNLSYILCEVNDYFNSVTKPRIEKAIYSREWNNGKPITRDGISQCFKYIRLEQYEDTLNNLEIKKTQTNWTDDEFHESYMLSYMLDTETRDSLLNLQWFVNPFNMTLKTTKDNELVETKVDMVETFNYLIGLNVETEDWHQDENICVVQGITHRDGLKTLVIWRNCEKIDNETLCRFFAKMDFRTRDTEFDQIYVNGDNTLPNLRRDEEHWKVVLIEEEFQKRMFEED